MTEMVGNRAALEALHADGAPLTSALRWLADTHGHIDPERIPDLADIYNLSLAEVSGVVSFYPDFSDLRTDSGHVLRVCQAEACQAVGSRALSDHARVSLGAEIGEASADAAIRLAPVYCLGLCACGPAIEIDGQAHGRVDNARLDALIAVARKADA